MAESSITEETVSSAQQQPQGSGQPQEPPKPPPFVYPTYQPHMHAVEGVFFDFNFGARVLVPPEQSGRKFRVLLRDRKSRNILHDGIVQPNMCVHCAKKYLIEYIVTIYDADTGKELYSHEFDPAGKEILVQLPVDGALGDSIAWFSVLETFRQRTRCDLHVLLPQRIRELYEPNYPDIKFIDTDKAKDMRPYASYYLGLYFKGDTDWQPYDFRLVSLAGQAAQILGMDDWQRRLDDAPVPRPVVADIELPKEPYVCIATHASSHAKHWCNPAGWRSVIRKLVESGYRVLCIDRDPEVGDGDVWHTIPNGCEDWTGARPLAERAALIKGAACFIGLSSGLSWLAWSAGASVVLISGICMPYGEFYTPYRVQARHTCHGCWNDTRCEFDHKDFMWCPFHKGTPRSYECTKAITADMVLDAVAKVPGMKLK